jgi:cytidylate kinase
MAIITVSRQVGSLGTEVAQTVASRLHYDYLDKEKIEKALVERGLPMLQVEKFDEKKPPFWVSWQIQSRKFLHVVQAVIYDFAQRGNIVIVGRGGQILMRDIPGIIHLRIVSPFSTRVQMIAEQEKIDEKQAIRVIRRNDRDSAGFIRFFFDEDWEDPTLYDLIINMQKMSIALAADMISSFALSPEIKSGEKVAADKLRDLSLEQKVEAALLDLVGMNLRLIHIQVNHGTVTLKGSVPTGVDMENCQRVVAAIEGVLNVTNLLTVGKFYPYGI